MFKESCHQLKARLNHKTSRNYALNGALYRTLYFRTIPTLSSGENCSCWKFLYCPFFRKTENFDSQTVRYKTVGASGARRLKRGETFKELTNALIHSSLSYGKIGWSGTYNNEIKPLEIAKSYVSRLCTRKSKPTRPNKCFKKVIFWTSKDQCLKLFQKFQIVFSNNMIIEKPVWPKGKIILLVHKIYN